jgi:hypothetical protein
VPGATPLSELLSDPATRSEWLGPEHARARLQCRACVACVPAGGRYVRVASRVRVRVCECGRQERRLACESFFPVVKGRAFLVGL